VDEEEGVVPVTAVRGVLEGCICFLSNKLEVSDAHDGLAFVCMS